VAGQTVGQIAQGILIFLGVARDDSTASADYLVKKITELRIFEDAQGKMNLSAQQVRGQFLVVPQFTLYGNCDKGRRPSFDQAALPAKGEELYDYFVTQLKATKAKVEIGQFKAMMDVSLVNDGPVTFIIDSK
jgi:D-tyrosyl-tRNA(Tyr) deacylase